MNDFLERPAGDFVWGPEDRRFARLREQLPALAIGSGFVLSVAGLIYLVQG